MMATTITTTTPTTAISMTPLRRPFFSSSSSFHPLLSILVLLLLLHSPLPSNALTSKFTWWSRYRCDNHCTKGSCKLVLMDPLDQCVSVSSWTSTTNTTYACTENNTVLVSYFYDNDKCKGTPTHHTSTPTAPACVHGTLTYCTVPGME